MRWRNWRIVHNQSPSVNLLCEARVRFCKEQSTRHHQGSAHFDFPWFYIAKASQNSEGFTNPEGFTQFRISIFMAAIVLRFPSPRSRVSTVNTDVDLPQYPHPATRNQHQHRRYLPRNHHLPHTIVSDACRSRRHAPRTPRPPRTAVVHSTVNNVSLVPSTLTIHVNVTIRYRTIMISINVICNAFYTKGEHRPPRGRR